MMLRVLVFAVVVGAIVIGVRRIVSDWRERFRALDKEDDERRRARDLKEREQPGVIALKRDADGVYRPGGSDGTAARQRD